MSVAAAARTLADTLLGQRGRGLSVGTMIMGYDGSQERSELMGKDSAQLFYVDSEGARVKGRYFSVGYAILRQITESPIDVSKAVPKYVYREGHHDANVHGVRFRRTGFQPANVLLLKHP